MEEKVINSIEDNTTQPIQAEEKMFTQSEVNEIVKKRLSRVKDNGSDEKSPVTDQDLIARSNRLDCKEYLLDNGLSTALLDVIDTSNKDAFIEKVEALSGIVKEAKVNSYPAVRDVGEPITITVPDSVKSAFFNKGGHKPKKKIY